MVVVVVGCPGLATACDLHVVRLVDNRVEGGSGLRSQLNAPFGNWVGSWLGVGLSAKTFSGVGYGRLLTIWRVNRPLPTPNQLLTGFPNGA